MVRKWAPMCVTTCVHIVNDVTTKQWFKNCMLMMFELLAGNVRQQQNKSHSRCGSVAKNENRVPMLHGNHQKKLPMQHEHAKTYVCDITAARMPV